MGTQEIVVPSPKDTILYGSKALFELKRIIQNRKDKLVINGKQYLFFSDWQLLGVFFGMSARVTKTAPIEKEVPSSEGTCTFREVIGFHAWADAIRSNNEIISSAEAECLYDEPNWKGKPRFAVLSMAETRACAKVLRNCLNWVVKLPGNVKDGQLDLSDEIAEEIS